MGAGTVIDHKTNTIIKDGFSIFHFKEDGIPVVKRPFGNDELEKWELNGKEILLTYYGTDERGGKNYRCHSGRLIFD